MEWSSAYLTQDNVGDIWFTDPRRNQIGFIDIQTKEITTKTIPKLDPLISDNIPTGIQADLEGNIWIAISNKDRIVKYSTNVRYF